MQETFAEQGNRPRIGQLPQRRNRSLSNLRIVIPERLNESRIRWRRIEREERVNGRAPRRRIGRFECPSQPFDDGFRFSDLGDRSGRAEPDLFGTIAQPTDQRQRSPTSHGLPKLAKSPGAGLTDSGVRIIQRLDQGLSGARLSQLS